MIYFENCILNMTFDKRKDSKTLHDSAKFRMMESQRKQIFGGRGE